MLSHLRFVSYQSVPFSLVVAMSDSIFGHLLISIAVITAHLSSRRYPSSHGLVLAVELRFYHFYCPLVVIRGSAGHWFTLACQHCSHRCDLNEHPGWKQSWSWIAGRSHSQRLATNRWPAAVIGASCFQMCLCFELFTAIVTAAGSTALSCAGLHIPYSTTTPPAIRYRFWRKIYLTLLMGNASARRYTATEACTHTHRHPRIRSQYWCWFTIWGSKRRCIRKEPAAFIKLCVSEPSSCFINDNEHLQL